MTIQREEPGLYVGICDQCGERVMLDTELNEPIEEAGEELTEKGWKADKPETVKFTGISVDRGYKVEYATHRCPDCQE